MRLAAPVLYIFYWVIFVLEYYATQKTVVPKFCVVGRQGSSTSEDISMIEVAPKTKTLGEELLYSASKFRSFRAVVHLLPLRLCYVSCRTIPCHAHCTSGGWTMGGPLSQQRW